MVTQTGVCKTLEPDPRHSTGYLLSKDTKRKLLKIGLLSESPPRLRKCFVMQKHLLVLNFDIQLTMVTCKLYIFYVGWRLNVLNFFFFSNLISGSAFFVYGFIGLIGLNVHRSCRSESLFCLLKSWYYGDYIWKMRFMEYPPSLRTGCTTSIEKDFLNCTFYHIYQSPFYKSQKTCFIQKYLKKLTYQSNYSHVISFKYKTGYLMDCL